MSEEAAAPAAADSGLQARLAAMEQKNQELLSEMKKEREKRTALEQQAEEQRKQKLQEQGKVEELYKEAQARIKELEKALAEKDQQLSQKDQETQQYLAKVQFVNAAADKVLKPEQLYRLESDHIRMSNGQLVGVYKGAEMPIANYLDAIAQDADYQHHFRPKGVGGMGATPSGAPAGGNPYLTGNLTERIALELQNPELAKQLESQARSQQKAAA